LNCFQRYYAVSLRTTPFTSKRYFLPKFAKFERFNDVSIKQTVLTSKPYSSLILAKTTLFTWFQRFDDILLKETVLTSKRYFQHRKHRLLVKTVVLGKTA